MNLLHEHNEMGTQKARYWKTKLDSLVGSDIKNTSATYSVSICFKLMPVQLVHELIIHRHRLYYKAKICFLCYLEYLHSFKFAGLQTVKKTLFQLFSPPEQYGW